jgi:hypothetical protein
MKFDVTTVPFSHFGSWMSISVPAGQSELYLRNHHMRANNLFTMRLAVDGKAVTPAAEGHPALLALSAGEAKAEICFDGPGSIRIRGRKSPLIFSGKRIHAYVNGTNLAVFNLRLAFRRYQFEVLRGSLQMLGAYVSEEEDLENLATHQGGGDLSILEGLDRSQPSLVIIPDPDGCWEVAIDEFWSSWERPVRAPFEDCLKRAKAEFEGFRDALPPAPDQFKEARELAAYINWSCTVGPCQQIKRPTLLMSKNWMNNVWSWDQCFNAMALAHGHPELAMDQMLTLVDHQDEFGAYPDAFNDMEIHYNYSKPPVHGFTFSELLKTLPARPGRDVVESMYTSLGRQANWWMKFRCDGANTGLKSLPYYLHGNDSGWDNSTMFAKGVPLVSPDLASLLTIQMDVLSDLAKELGRSEEAKAWKARADQLFTTLMAELWNKDHFVAKLGNTGEAVESLSLIPWLPIILGDRLPAHVRECLKRGIEGHITEWGLATERVDSPCYIADGYWRGPVWAPSTFLAVAGLERSGYPDLAADIAARFCRLCARSGFAENFNALTGAPLRDKAYTWTASGFLLLAQKLK